MKERIRKIMESLNMTQQSFAELLGISSATLSGMFNGRTKPTHGITEAIHKKLPRINMMWVLYGEGDMYVDSSDQQTGSERVASPSAQVELDFEDETPVSGKTTGGKARQTASGNDAATKEMKNVDKPRRRITEIKVYYDDLTYESFVPEKK
ncbi:MAG: helix-turn-helix transcriptional regulator [Prevotella sp.]|nr:helix-turn-helix transcriptional regulator [Prevotella sp.]